MELDHDLKSRQEVRDLVEAAAKAQEALKKMSQSEIDRIVQEMMQSAKTHAEELAKMARDETGFGTVGDKVQKNLFASEKLWSVIKDQKTVGILRKDHENKVWDVAVPVGVIAGIVPSTNPTSTVIYKSMIALKSGNAIVFSPHPGAKLCSLRAAQLMAQAIERAGGPKDAVSCISAPTMQAVDELMKHPKVSLILATGGGAMVKAAYSSGTPAIGVGAGNGPAYLHGSCDLKKAVSDIIRSKTFDNGTVCASEQSIILERAYAKEAEDEFIRQGCCILDEGDNKRLASFLFRENGTMNPKIVGKPASELAQLAGLCDAAKQSRVLLARETDAGKQFPYSMEKLCPVLGLYVVEDEDRALALSCKILNHEGRGHTFAIHAKDERVIQRFALAVPVSRFLVNTPASLGGIGATTGLFPALTLGCGAVGGSSSSNNIGPLDLINIRRVAWGDKQPETVHTTVTSVDDDLVEKLAQKLLQRIKQ